MAAKNSNLKRCSFSYSNKLYIGVYVSAAPKPAFVQANRYSGNAATSYMIRIERGFNRGALVQASRYICNAAWLNINTYVKFD